MVNLSKKLNKSVIVKGLVDINQGRCGSGLWPAIHLPVFWFGIRTKMRVKLASKILITAWTMMKNNGPFNPDLRHIFIVDIRGYRMSP